MQDIKTAINETNKNNNFPSQAKLIKLVQELGYPKEDIIKAIKADVNTQLTTSRKQPKFMGHVIALAPFEKMQMDILDLQKFKGSNKLGDKIYPYMLVLIDIFSRFAYVEPLENKTAGTVLNTFQKLVDKIEKPTEVKKGKTKSDKIRIIISDNEGSFQSNIFEKYLDEHLISLTMNALNDHRVLGVIDNFAKKLKTILTKHFLLNKSKRWLDIIDKIISIYNNTEHTALNNLTPSQAKQLEYFEQVAQINLDKMEANRRVSDLEIGDKVRKYDLFKKSISKPSLTPQWTDKIFTVKKVQGQTITLDDDTKHKRYNLLVVPEDTPESEPNIISKELKKT
jgi:hypothetical protein